MLLKDCCNFQEGYVNPDRTKSEYFTNGTINWLKATDIKNNFIYGTEDKINKVGLSSCGNQTIFPCDSIVLSKSGTVGNIGILKCNVYGNRATINIIPNEEKVNPMFIYYLLSARKEELKARAVGSIQKNLYISCLEPVDIGDFDRNTQDKIAEILSEIDEQINRNNEVVKKLQVLGNTIYGKGIHSTKSFECIDCSRIKTGKEDANFATSNGKYNFFTCSEDTFLCDDFAFEGKSILIAGNGNFNVKFSDGKFNVYQRVYVISDEEKYGNLYYTYMYHIQALSQKANGSIIKFLTINMLKNITIPIFDDNINSLLNDVVLKIHKINIQTKRLVNLKESVLPLLINGQLHFVNKVEDVQYAC